MRNEKLEGFKDFVKFCSLCSTTLVHHDNKSWAIPEALMQSYEAVCSQEFRKQWSLSYKKWYLREFCSAIQKSSNEDQHLTPVIVYEILQLVSINYLPFTVVNAGLICEFCKSKKTQTPKLTMFPL